MTKKTRIEFFEFYIKLCTTEFPLFNFFSAITVQKLKKVLGSQVLLFAVKFITFVLEMIQIAIKYYKLKLL